MVSAEKSNVKQKEEESIKYQLYQCYVDLSELIFPGSKREQSFSYMINNIVIKA